MHTHNVEKVRFLVGNVGDKPFLVVGRFAPDELAVVVYPYRGGEFSRGVNEVAVVGGATIAVGMYHQHLMSVVAEVYRLLAENAVERGYGVHLVEL